MAIARITGPGLISIWLLVVCLWVCIFEESRINARANQQLAWNLIQLRNLRDGRRAIPAKTPSKHGRAVAAVQWSATAIGI
jgi:hypothetical protein